MLWRGCHCHHRVILWHPFFLTLNETILVFPDQKLLQLYVYFFSSINEYFHIFVCQATSLNPHSSTPSSLFRESPQELERDKE